MRARWFCVAVVIMAGTAAYAITPEEYAQRRAASEKVLAATPDAQQTWESLGDGALRHKPSGLVCPSDARPEIPLSKVVILKSPPPEHNALCMYSSADETKSVQLAATKVATGLPAEIVFAKMRQSLVQQDGGLKSLGFQRNLLVPSALGEGFAATENGKPCLTYLWVVVVKDWAVWSVATIPSAKQDASTANLYGLTLLAPFTIGVQGVVNTAQGVPEPRTKTPAE
jgi:hypothetical protein